MFFFNYLVFSFFYFEIFLDLFLFDGIIGLKDIERRREARLPTTLKMSGFPLTNI